MNANMAFQTFLIIWFFFINSILSAKITNKYLNEYCKRHCSVPWQANSHKCQTCYSNSAITDASTFNPIPTPASTQFSLKKETTTITTTAASPGSFSFQLHHCEDKERRVLCFFFSFKAEYHDEGLSTVNQIIISSIIVIIGLIIVLLCWRLCCVLRKCRKSLPFCCNDCCTKSVHTSSSRTTASQNVAPVPNVSAAVEHTRSPTLSKTSSHSCSTTTTTSSSRPQRTTTSRQQNASQQRSNSRTQNGEIKSQQKSRSAHENTVAYADDDLPSYSVQFRGDGTETQRGKQAQGKIPPPLPSNC